MSCPICGERVSECPHTEEEIRAARKIIENLELDEEPLQIIHHDHCWDQGPAHYECALRKIRELLK